MSDVRLKNYLQYLQKIETYADTSGIKIFRRPEPGDGSFNPNNSAITIDPDLSESAEIATLLHELGHAYDYHLMNEKLSPSIWNAYEKVYDGLHTTKHLSTVVKAEIRAWENGKLIAKRLKIRLGKWYENERKTALSNYRRA